MKTRLSLVAGLLAGVAFGAEVDFSADAGAIRPLNGLCNLAPLSNSRMGGIGEQVKALKIPYYRHHDAALLNPGLRLLDVSRVFPLFHLNPDDPRNYDFRASDDYLEQAVREGAEIEFRLGESIEHTPRQYAVDPPADYAKWAEICVHIVRHYNEGWANGHRWNIRRWTIWEEPNSNPTLFNVPNKDWRKHYFPLYATVAKRLKAEFPDLEVGGPQTNNGGPDAVQAFVEYCASNAVPLDILSWSSYERDPEAEAARVATNRRLLDDNGFTKAKQSLCEWHWGPTSWMSHGGVRNRAAAAAWQTDLAGIDSATYTAALMMRLQDSAIDYMHYYTVVSSSWGLFDATSNPAKPYWAFMAFSELRECPVRVKADLNPLPGVYVLAGADRAAGRGRILVAALRTDAGPQVVLKGCRGIRSVRVLDASQDLTETKLWKWKDGKLELFRCYSDSAVWLVECDL